MENYTTLYTIGLILVILFIFTSLDDFLWDLLSIFRRIRQKTESIPIEELDAKPPKLIALIIAAWHEDNVLYDVIENIIVSQQYPRSMYHIFIGVYPNDDRTVKVAESLKEKYPNIHCVINAVPGPTSKAQNINHVIQEIRNFEKEMKWSFSTFTIHDSEDVVHPYEFKVTNYLMDECMAIQFPVFPLIKKPSLKNFFENITTNTYVDEFAENHFITMVNRHSSGAFVPSAGTGFSLSRKVIDLLGESVLPENSLTEDYRLSLTLYEMGIHMRYVLEKVRRVNPQGTFVNEFIATRSLFPNTFRTAVKQKTRWTLGITMQSFRFRDILKGNLPFVGRYSLYKDQKAKIGNLLAVLGYPVFAYFIVSLFTQMDPIYPKFSLSWYLSLVVTIMMIERQLFRAISLYQVYGLKSALFGTFFPPLLPVRLIWGNIINFVSTINAYIQFFGKVQKKKDQDITLSRLQTEEYNARTDIRRATNDILEDENLIMANEMAIQAHPIETVAKKDHNLKKFNWSKTEHSFLDKENLIRFQRKLGDILLEKRLIEPTHIVDYLNQEKPEMTIGGYLLENNIITESQLMEALASVKHVRLLDESALKYYDLKGFSQEFEEDFLYNLKAFPLLKTHDTYLFVYCDRTPPNAQSILREKTGKKMITALATCPTIEKALQEIYGKDTESESKQVNQLQRENNICTEQLLIINHFAGQLNVEPESVAKVMGLIDPETHEEPLPALNR